MMRVGTLDGKTVFITGVARGQGRSQAIAVAREGANVIGCDICAQIDGLDYPLASEADLAETTRLVEALDRRIVARVADVRDQAAIDGVVSEGVAEFGSLDGVVANAGTWVPGGTLDQISEQGWQAIIDTTLSGSWRTIKAAAPHLISSGGGSMVLISSLGGVEAFAGSGAYVAAKHGVIGLMRQAAFEYGPSNIRVNALAPGAMDTRIWNNTLGYGYIGGGGRAEAIDAVYGSGVLAGRSALPAQATSNAVVWLLSDLAEHVTGVILPVDAGHLIQPGWNMAPIKTGPVADRYRPPADAPL